MKIYQFVILLICLTACQHSIEQKLINKKNDSNTLIITDVDIFNGVDSILIRHKDVYIQNGIIKSIGSDLSQEFNEIMTINGSGKTLMPGLIDAHVHLSGSGCVPWEKVPADMVYNLSAYLYAGVTTVYDLGGLSGDLEKLSNQVKTGDILGPTVYHTHIPITVKNSHPIPLTQEMLPFPLKGLVNQISPTINAPEEAKQLIASYSKHDIDYVKISCDQIPSGSPEMTFEQLKALIDEAHKLNYKVFVHIGSPENALNAIKAGADVLAHGIWRGKLNDVQADAIAESKIPIIYTLAGFKNVKDIYNGKFLPSDLDKRLVPNAVLKPVTGEKGKDSRNQEIINLFFKDVDKHSPDWLSNFKLLYDRNVPILIGTDSNLPGTYAGSTYFQEISLLKLFGMTNYEILKSATYLNSKVFVKQPDFGIVEEGFKANLLLINGNPLEELDLIKKPNLIFFEGSIIEKVEF